MGVTLSLVSPDVDDEDLHGLTRDLCQTLNRETEVEAALAEQPGGTGTRGELISLGTIALTFISSGAAVAVFEVLKSYFERNRSLEMEFQRGDGKIFKLWANNLKPEQIDRFIEQADAFWGGSA